MSIKKSMIAALSVAVGALGAYGEAAFSQSFESLDLGTLSIKGWTGYGTVEAPEAAIKLPSAGAPITGKHTRNLAVDGWVETNLAMADATTDDRQLDMLVKVARPEDALEGMSDAEAKFALAVDADGVLKYYTGAAWASLGYSAFTEGDWIRVAIIFDAASKRCKVSVNGEAATTGKKTAAGTEEGGPWYATLNDSTTLAALKVVGTTALDDLVMNAVANADYTPSYKDEDGRDIEVQAGAVRVPLAWFDKNNVSTSLADGQAPDGSGMTIADKYITGVKLDGSKFELKKIRLEQVSMYGDKEKVQVYVTLPEFNVAEKYGVHVQGRIGDGDWEDQALAKSNTEVLISSFLASDYDVCYFRLVVVPH